MAVIEGDGSSVKISRIGRELIVTTGPEPNAEAFYFPFAGGYIGGSNSTGGTFEVYVSTNGRDDPYQPLHDENDLPITIAVPTGNKLSFPQSLFNAGWIKLVGPAGTVRLHGVG